MASPEGYRAIVKDLFDELAEVVRTQSSPRPDGAETICVRDQDGANYLVVRYGWRDGHRVRGVSLFVRVRDERVIVEEDMTDWGMVDRLVEHGVAPEHIVLAWQSAEATAAEPVVA